MNEVAIGEFNVNNSVFISYRRSVSAFIARAVFQDLRAQSYDVIASAYLFIEVGK